MTTGRCFLFFLVVTFGALQTATAGATCGQGGECPARSEAKDDVLLQLQGALKTKDVEGHHNRLQKAGTEDDLPVARSVSEMQTYIVSDRHREAGAQHLAGVYGPLTTKFVKMSADLTSYWARVIQKVGQSTGPNQHSDNFEPASRAQLRDIMSEWRTELLNFGTCPDDPLDMEACMGLTRCLIEEEVGQTITPALFASFMEIHDELENVIIRDFELEFQESRTTQPHACEGEPEDGEDSDLIDSHGSLVQAQQGAAATVAMVQRASDSTVQALESEIRLETHDFQRIWSGPCAALGCNHSSWLDIMQSVHGHAATLVEVGASARTIRVHVRSMRAAHRALKNAVSRSSAFTANFEGILRRRGQNTAANKRYDLAIKDVGGMIDGAYMLMRGSRTAVSWFNWCFSVMAGGLSAYAKKFGGHPTYFMGAIVSFSAGAGISQRDMLYMLVGSEDNNQRETDVPGIGGWGGTCTCPDGQVYDVGDNGDSCGSLACVGGTPGVCQDHDGRRRRRRFGGQHVRVSCGPDNRMCDNHCNYNYDGDCDDGGDNSDYSICDIGSDCHDCGPRPEGSGPCPFTGGEAQVTFGLLIGFVGGAADQACTRAGVSITASLSFNSCGQFVVSITASASGSIVWSSSDCSFGDCVPHNGDGVCTSPWFIEGRPGVGTFNCAEGVTVGVGMICCNYNLITGEGDC